MIIKHKYTRARQWSFKLTLSVSGFHFISFALSYVTLTSVADPQGLTNTNGKPPRLFFFNANDE